MTKLCSFVVTLAAACAAADPPLAMPTHPVPATRVAPFRATVSGHGPPILFLPGLSSPGEVWNAAVAPIGGILAVDGVPFMPALGDPMTTDRWPQLALDQVPAAREVAR